jgi:hypothetical protein
MSVISISEEDADRIFGTDKSSDTNKILTRSEMLSMDIVDLLLYCDRNGMYVHGVQSKAAEELVALRNELELLKMVTNAYNPVSQGRQM